MAGLCGHSRPGGIGASDPRSPRTDPPLQAGQWGMRIDLEKVGLAQQGGGVVQNNVAGMPPRPEERMQRREHRPAPRGTLRRTDPRSLVHVRLSVPQKDFENDDDCVTPRGRVGVQP